jgi:hypothetical protein
MYLIFATHIQHPYVDALVDEQDDVYGDTALQCVLPVYVGLNRFGV